MGGDNFFNSVTHIIIDEVHERDKMCDFLLTILKVTKQAKLPYSIRNKSYYVKYKSY